MLCNYVFFFFIKLETYTQMCMSMIELIQYNWRTYNHIVLHELTFWIFAICLEQILHILQTSAYQTIHGFILLASANQGHI